MTPIEALQAIRREIDKGAPSPAVFTANIEALVAQGLAMPMTAQSNFYLSREAAARINNALSMAVGCGLGFVWAEQGDTALVLGEKFERNVLRLTEVLALDAATPQLTPAQQHADELFELLLSGMTAGPVGKKWRDRADVLRLKISPPEPPTHDELIAVLRKLVTGGTHAPIVSDVSTVTEALAILKRHDESQPK